MVMTGNVYLCMFVYIYVRRFRILHSIGIGFRRGLGGRRDMCLGALCARGWCLGSWTIVAGGCLVESGLGRRRRRRRMW